MSNLVLEDYRSMWLKELHSAYNYKAEAEFQARVAKNLAHWLAMLMKGMGRDTSEFKELKDAQLYTEAQIELEEVDNIIKMFGESNNGI